MDIRPALRTGGSLALGVLALGAVQSGLTLAMAAGGGTTSAGWTPMPDPADGGVGSPPFPVNLTAEERANLETFDALDFDVFSRQDWSRLGESHAPYIRVHWPDGHYTDGIDKHTEDMAALFVWAPDLRIDAHRQRVRPQHDHRRDLEPPGHDGRGVPVLGRPDLLPEDRPGLTRWLTSPCSTPSILPPPATSPERI